MKIKFIDLNKSLCDKVSEIGYFKVFNEDITKHITDDTVIVSASNPDFTFGGGIDALIQKLYPKECEQKQNRKGGNERIGNVIFTITVDNDRKANKIYLAKALQSILAFGKEDETILLTGLGTGIGGLSEDDFIEVLLDVFPKKAYKGFKHGMICDGCGTCEYEFKEGEIYNQDGEVRLCNNGFHYCYNLEQIYLFYPRNSIICEVEILGNIDFGYTKSCTSKIKVNRKLNEYEIFKLKDYNTGNYNTGNYNTGNYNTGNYNTGNYNTGDSNTGDSNIGDSNTGNYNTGYSNTGYRNTGDRNTGDRNTGDSNTGYSNTGDRNTGDRNTGDSNTGYSNTGYSNTGDSNTGDRNTGDRNTGDRNTGDSNTGYSNTGNYNTGYSNTGDWNKSNYNSGYFNTIQSKVTIFNKLSKFDFGDINFPYYFYFNLTDWIYSNDMTEQEKIDNPNHTTQGGFLRKYNYKEQFIKSFEKASKSEIEETIKLPNFDYKIFEEISGITKKMIQDKLNNF